ncbi:MAG: hypothetical protein GY802_18115, partial [Gammaproteobacteria bacterium]|nr:hypothetical protein [Gammaproteobacteria bacterium]
IGFEASLDSDDVIFTHWLDVILYKLYFGEVVRIHVARKLGDIIAKNSTSEIHILSHSLGTAVTHDTLSKIYNNDTLTTMKSQACHRSRTSSHRYGKSPMSAGWPTAS